MNKKIIKTITSITCGLGAISIIPCTATSCNENNATLTSFNSIDELLNFNFNQYKDKLGLDSNKDYSLKNPETGEHYTSSADIDYVGHINIDLCQKSYNVDTLFQLLCVGYVMNNLYEAFKKSVFQADASKFYDFLRSDQFWGFKYSYSNGSAVVYGDEEQEIPPAFSFNENIKVDWQYYYESEDGQENKVDLRIVFDVATIQQVLISANDVSAVMTNLSVPMLEVKISPISPFEDEEIFRLLDKTTHKETKNKQVTLMTPFNQFSNQLIDKSHFVVK